MDPGQRKYTDIYVQHTCLPGSRTHKEDICQCYISEIISRGDHRKYKTTLPPYEYILDGQIQGYALIGQMV